jgi:hypothetical protein
MAFVNKSLSLSECCLSYKESNGGKTETYDGNDAKETVGNLFKTIVSPSAWRNHGKAKRSVIGLQVTNGKGPNREPPEHGVPRTGTRPRA